MFTTCVVVALLVSNTTLLPLQVFWGFFSLYFPKEGGVDANKNVFKNSSNN